MVLFEGFMDLQRFVRREQNTITPMEQTIIQAGSTTQNNHTTHTNITTKNDTEKTQSSPLSTNEHIHILEDIIATVPNTPHQTTDNHKLPPLTNTPSSFESSTQTDSKQTEPQKPEVINLDSLLSGLEKIWNIQVSTISKPKHTFPTQSNKRSGRSTKAWGIVMIAFGAICLGGLLYFYLITTNPLLFDKTTTTTQAATQSNIPSIADFLTQSTVKPKKEITALTSFENAVGANDAETTINVLDIMDLLEKELTTIQHTTGIERRLQSTATMLLKNLHTARKVLDESPHTPNWNEIKDILTRIQTIYQNTIISHKEKNDN